MKDEGSLRDPGYIWLDIPRNIIVATFDFYCQLKQVASSCVVNKCVDYLPWGCFSDLLSQSHSLMHTGEFHSTDAEESAVITVCSRAKV